MTTTTPHGQSNGGGSKREKKLNFDSFGRGGPMVGGTGRELISLKGGMFTTHSGAPTMQNP
jgi:hypothetical protein